MVSIAIVACHAAPAMVMSPSSTYTYGNEVEIQENEVQSKIAALQKAIIDAQNLLNNKPIQKVVVPPTVDTDIPSKVIALQKAINEIQKQLAAQANYVKPVEVIDTTSQLARLQEIYAALQKANQDFNVSNGKVINKYPEATIEDLITPVTDEPSVAQAREKFLAYQKTLIDSANVNAKYAKNYDFTVNEGSGRIPVPSVPSVDNSALMKIITDAQIFLQKYAKANEVKEVIVTEVKPDVEAQIIALQKAIQEAQKLIQAKSQVVEIKKVVVPQVPSESEQIIALKKSLAEAQALLAKNAEVKPVIVPTVVPVPESKAVVVPTVEKKIVPTVDPLAEQIMALQKSVMELQNIVNARSIQPVESAVNVEEPVVIVSDATPASVIKIKAVEVVTEKEVATTEEVVAATAAPVEIKTIAPVVEEVEPVVQPVEKKTEILVTKEEPIDLSELQKAIAEAENVLANSKKTQEQTVVVADKSVETEKAKQLLSELQSLLAKSSTVSEKPVVEAVETEKSVPATGPTQVWSY